MKKRKHVQWIAVCVVGGLILGSGCSDDSGSTDGPAVTDGATDGAPDGGPAPDSGPTADAGPRPQLSSSTVDPDGVHAVQALAGGRDSDEMVVAYTKQVGSETRAFAAYAKQGSFGQPAQVDGTGTAVLPPERVLATLLPVSKRAAVVAQTFEKDSSGKTVIRIYGAFHDGTGFGAAQRIDPGDTPFTPGQPSLADVRILTSPTTDDALVLMERRPAGEQFGIWAVPIDETGFGTVVRLDSGPAQGTVQFNGAFYGDQTALVCFYEHAADKARLICRRYDGASFGPAQAVDHSADGIPTADQGMELPRVWTSPTKDRALVLYAVMQTSDGPTSMPSGDLYAVALQGQTASPAVKLSDGLSGMSGIPRGGFSPVNDEAMITFLRTKSVSESVVHWLRLDQSGLGAPAALTPSVTEELMADVYPRLQFFPHSGSALMAYVTPASAPDTARLAAHLYDGSQGTVTPVSGQLEGFLGLRLQTLSQSDRAVVVFDRMLPDNSAVVHFGALMEQGALGAPVRLDPALESNGINSAEFTTSGSTDQLLVLLPGMASSSGDGDSSLVLFDGSAFRPAVTLSGCVDHRTLAVGGGPGFVLLCGGDSLRAVQVMP